MITLLADAGSTTALPISFILVYVVGFVAAISIGSVAWYNSKRPVGWEDAKRPNIVPKIGDRDE